MSIGIQIKNIPQVVLDEVALHLKHYTVLIYTLVPGNLPPYVNPVGSGTLVEVKGTHSILTAAHVWDQIKDADQIGLVLTDHRTRFTINPEAISAKELWSSGNTGTDEWGPDLALLQLAPSDISTIKAYKSFLNLAKQKVIFLENPPPAIGEGFWVFIGMVEEFSDIQTSPEQHTTTTIIPGRAYFSVIHKTHEHDGYDYIDLSAKLELPDVPSSFAGVSGGGLWEVGLSMKAGEIVWEGKRLFRGVVFGQTPKANGRRLIRCHGPRSIFERAWESWALPLGN